MTLQKESKLRKQGEQAFTVRELMVVVFVVAILVALLLPHSHGGRQKATQIYCVNNLKQVGLSIRTWGEDNGDVYPMHYKTNSFDGAKYANGDQMFIYFQVASNELVNPKVLICPADSKRSAATNFTSDFNSSKISYFVGLDCDETRPNSLFSGDRNLTNGFAPKNGVLTITTNNLPGWTKDMHQFSGNVALGDGSVQKTTVKSVQRLIPQIGLATNRLVLPGGTN